MRIEPLHRLNDWLYHTRPKVSWRTSSWGMNSFVSLSFSRFFTFFFFLLACCECSGHFFADIDSRSFGLNLHLGSQCWRRRSWPAVLPNEGAFLTDVWWASSLFPSPVWTWWPPIACSPSAFLDSELLFSADFLYPGPLKLSWPFQYTEGTDAYNITN